MHTYEYARVNIHGRLVLAAGGTTSAVVRTDRGMLCIDNVNLIVYALVCMQGLPSGTLPV